MKNFLSIIVAVMCLGMIYDSNAATTCTRTTTKPSGLDSTVNIEGCTGTTTIYYVYGTSLLTLLGNCSACGTGYTREAVTTSNVNTASSSWNAVTSVCSNVSSMISGLYTCVAKTCTDCTSDTNWTNAATTGYQKKTTATCNAGVCTKTTEYRCAQGYWGSSTNGTSGCTECDKWTGVYTNSSMTTQSAGYCSAGTTARTGCFIIPTTLYDASGTFDLSNVCYYSS